VDKEPSRSSSNAGRRLSKTGASKGGRTRAQLLTPAERSLIARDAVNTRWAKAGKKLAADLPKSVGSTELPHSLFRGSLDIGTITFECHVLSDQRRVLTQREVVRLLSGGRDSSNLQRYLTRNPLVPVDFLDGRIIEFRVPGVAQNAHGYEASVLIDICDFYVQAREENLLKPTQIPLAATANIIIRACAKVGIEALIDEATGYQQVRAKRALQLKLQAFIAEEMQEWVARFPDEFWYELARLEGIEYSPQHRPLRWGKYVMMFIYDAIDPDVGRELRAKNPNPRFKSNHHQWLKEFGQTRLNNQIQQVIAIMKLCDDMDDFRRKFARVFKKGPLQLELDFTT